MSITYSDAGIIAVGGFRSSPCRAPGHERLYQARRCCGGFTTLESGPQAVTSALGQGRRCRPRDRSVRSHPNSACAPTRPATPALGHNRAPPEVPFLAADCVSPGPLFFRVTMTQKIPPAATRHAPSRCTQCCIATHVELIYFVLTVVLPRVKRIVVTQ
jgi:hypothetical protein